jgi:ABC-type dipeptide/oligopeptide/nickel transport system permease component
MTWLNLSLLTLILTLALVLVFSRIERLWAGLRYAATLGFQLSGVILLTWILVTLAQRNLGPPGEITLPSPPPTGLAIASTALTGAERSLVLMIAATLWGSAAGLGLAFLLTARGSRRLLLVVPLATLLWVIPTFLIAIAIQEVQAQLYSLTGTPVSGGFGAVNGLQVFWAAVVLGLRPAAYVFRQARVTLDLEVVSDHVRTARAKGLEWRVVVFRHVVRPAAATLLNAWMNSFRLMIGSLPLVEFFFGYPGLGEMLILALGLTFGIQGRAGQAQPDLAIALVVAMAAILLVLETLSGLLQGWLDPRLRELRRETA